MYTTSNVTHNCVANDQLIDLASEIPDLYEITAKENSVHSVQDISAVDKIYPSLKRKSNTISKMVNLCYDDEESLSST